MNYRSAWGGPLLCLLVLVLGSSAIKTPTCHALDTDNQLLSPPSTTAPVVVQAGFQLLEINDINDEAETFEFVGALTLRWHDPRLAFDPARAQLDEIFYQGDYQINEVFPGWAPQIVLLNQSGLYQTSGTSLRLKPDGTVILTQVINAVAEAAFSLRRYPFDTQRLQIRFGAVGFDKSEILLQAEANTSVGNLPRFSIVQWVLTGITMTTAEEAATHIGPGKVLSSLVISFDMSRESFFTVRLVVFPLAFIVALSWSVFWMERSSLGDRISVSFVGILTAVAYQIVVGDLLPHISYVTLMNGFLNISFIMMSATVVINLVIGALDRQGRIELGDLIDRRCRWIFPLTYFSLVSLITAAAFIFF